MGNAGAVGHAQRLHLTHPGGHVTTVHRGRCNLRAGSKTNAAAYDVTGVVPSRLTNGARAVPAGLDTLGGGREAGAPWEMRVRLGTPAIRANVTPTVTRPRRTEDGAPYGRLRNDRCGIQHNVHVTPSLTARLTASLKRTHTHTP